MERPKIRAKHQGTVIVEYDAANGYSILLPDGSVEFATEKKDVEKVAKRWSKDNIPSGYNAAMVEIDYVNEKDIPAEQPNPFEFHLKPSGWPGAPCSICGCPARNLRARHRALKADEAYEWGVPWIKRVRVAFGTDWSDEPIKG